MDISASPSTTKRATYGIPQHQHLCQAQQQVFFYYVMYNTTNYSLLFVSNNCACWSLLDSLNHKPVSEQLVRPIYPKRVASSILPRVNINITTSYNRD